MIGKERVRVRVIWEEWLAFEFGKRKKIEDEEKEGFCKQRFWRGALRGARWVCLLMVEEQRGFCGVERIGPDETLIPWILSIYRIYMLNQSYNQISSEEYAIKSPKKDTI